MCVETGIHAATKITVKCLAICLCPSNPSFTLKEGNKAPVSVFCNQSPTTIPVLDCPVDSLTILGNFGCASSDISKSCPQNAISWTLDLCSMIRLELVPYRILE